MKQSFLLTLIFYMCATCFANGCTSATETLLSTQTALPFTTTATSSPIPPTLTASPLPPTSTHTPLPSTDTLTPTPTFNATPLPGLMVLPVDTLGNTIPWLPLETSARPTINYVGFNVLRPPFNNVLVRQAFAYAVDREVLVEMAARYYVTNPKPATTLTPPVTLGLDLYNVVGATFNPQKAKDLLVEAGYTDPAAFPTATILVNAYGDTAPGARYNMANAMVEMWQTHLGVKVQVVVVATFTEYGERLRTNPSEIFWQGWVADQNDPDNFLGEIFRSDSQFNFGKFANRDYDRLMDNAIKSKNAADRQNYYVQAERLLCETETALIPLYHSTMNFP